MGGPEFPFSALRLTPSIWQKTGSGFLELLKSLDLKQPKNGTALDLEGALQAARSIGYPLILRPPTYSADAA